MEPNTLKPNSLELKFLNLAYNRFYDLYEEIMKDNFWKKNKQYRFSKMKDIFAIYSELLNYAPISWVIDNIKQNRPPMEAEIASELFKFIRNLISHFPFFEIWNDIYFDCELINWKGKEERIHKFLKKYKEIGTIKYRFWEEEKKKMTYLSINFPSSYLKGEKVYLRDILKEKEGIKFSIIMMKQVLDTQVEEIK